MRLLPLMRRRTEPAASLLVPIESAPPSEVGWIMGRVTLPVAADWGSCVTPAGRYTLFVPTHVHIPLFYLQSAEHDAVIFASSVERQPRSRTSELTLAVDGTGFRVRSFELGNPGLVFHFEPS